MRENKEPTRRVVVTVVMECDVWDQLPHWAVAAGEEYVRYQEMTDSDIQAIVQRQMAGFAAVFDTVGQKVRTRDVRLVRVDPA